MGPPCCRAERAVDVHALPPRRPPPPPADNILQLVIIQGSNGTSDAQSTYCRCGWVTGFLVGMAAPTAGGKQAVVTMGVRCRCGGW